jgi:hypothetical protein
MRVSVKASGKRYTVADVREFLNNCDQAHIAATAIVDARTNWYGALKELHLSSYHNIIQHEPPTQPDSD